MTDSAKLPIEMWAERYVKGVGAFVEQRTRIMISVPGDPPFELMSYPSDLPDKMANPQPLIIPVAVGTEHA